MTTHFISFLLDIFSSGFIGLVISLLMDRPTRLSVSSRIRDGVFMSISSMGLGMFLTLNYALPEEGIAVNILFLVSVSMLLIAFVYSRRFRNDTLQKVSNMLQSSHVRNPAM